jgi:tRNA/rRNA methyltransferase
MILCYEIFTVSSAIATGAQATPRLARSEELEGMYGQIKTLLAEIEFINPENPDYWMMHLRRFFARSALLSREVGIVRGVCRQLQWYAHHKKT